jgi:hypothetical protein
VQNLATELTPATDGFVAKQLAEVIKSGSYDVVICKES